jgi:hypothetical protein
VLLVDVPDEAVVDGITNQLLKSSGEELDSVSGDAELLVLLLTEKSCAVIHRNTHSTAVGMVGATAVPQASHPDEHAPFGHLCRDRVVVSMGIRGMVRRVGSRAQPGGPVLLGEIGDRPHCVADDGRVWFWHAYDLIVGVDHLGLFVGTDGDGGQRRDKETRIEDLLDDGEHVRMDRNPLVDRSVDEKIVDPRRPEALEEIVGRHDPQRPLQSKEVFIQLIDQIGRDCVLDDRPSVSPHVLGVGLDGRFIESPGVRAGAD